MNDIPGWVGLAVGAGGGGLISGLVTLYKARGEAGKTKADSAAALSSSAVAIVQGVQQELEALRDKVEQLEEREEERDRRDTVQERRLRVHERWDSTVAEKLRSLGEDIADPPPLYPDTTAA